jgi:hypothetical protein
VVVRYKVALGDVVQPEALGLGFGSVVRPSLRPRVSAVLVGRRPIFGDSMFLTYFLSYFLTYTCRFRVTCITCITRDKRDVTLGSVTSRPVIASTDSRRLALLFNPFSLFYLDYAQNLRLAQPGRPQRRNGDHRIAPHATSFASAWSSP